MMKKLTVVVLLLAMLLSLLPVASARVQEMRVQEECVPQSIDRCCCTRRVTEEKAMSRPTFEGKLSEITPQRVEDTFRYLDDFYVEAHPEMALQNHYGTEEDRAVLAELAQIVTEGCTTHKEMADAVSSWVARNIVYDENTSAYASDTFYRREGNCLSYAFLIQTMLRSLGVPAVLGDGWRGDMEESTVDLFNYAGHAWVFVYLDGQWELYDPLWLSESTTDRDYMAKWIYFDTVEFVTPAYDEENLPPEAIDKSKAYYTGEKFCLFSNSRPQGVGTLSCFINNIAVYFVSNQCEKENGISDGWYYLDGVSDKNLMDMGQIYTNSWISYGDYYNGKGMSLTYAHANGMIIDGGVMEFEGQDYLMTGSSYLPILADEADYCITDGMFTLPTDYTGKYLGFGFGEKATEGCTITVENLTPEVAVATADGTITCLNEGYAEFRVTLIRDKDNALMSINYISLLVSDELRVADFTDHGEQKPDESTEPDEPIEPDIPAENPFADVTENDYFADSVAWAVENAITNGMSATEFAPEASCTRGQIVTFLWRAQGCPEPKSNAKPFTDIKSDAYYCKAVLWAVENGITSGMSATTFEPETTCTRAQAATFIWRANGKPIAENKEHPFADIVAGEYYYEAVLWAVENEITNGFSATEFAPANNCTRAQIVTFLYRASAK